MSVVEENSRVAVWAITPNGVGLAGTLFKNIRNVDLFFSSNTDVQVKAESSGLEFRVFDRLKTEVADRFVAYSGHVFIMSTGIVVRMIASLISHKTTDPAVVVVDDAGRFAISLLAGHIGGANRLTQDIAQIMGATPVITTATDVNKIPAIDVLSMERGLAIENPEAIKTINMALLTSKKVRVYDPYGKLADISPVHFQSVNAGDLPEVWVDDRLFEIKPGVLVLRPGSLVAGIGCNRGTDKSEIRELLLDVLRQHGLSEKCLTRIATVDIKNDEEGILELAKDMKLPVEFFSREQLGQVKNIISPSEMVKQHIGVESVCEASAILAANQGELIVPKKKTKNVTVAIARIPCTSLV